MERSALYRRALAPISTFVGAVGIVAAIIGVAAKINSGGGFVLYWLIVGAVAIIGALALVRRQAVRQGENFWSPPTRRVAQAMVPPLLVGFIIGCVAAVVTWNEKDVDIGRDLIPAWLIFYGLALHAAGFFMPRGIRLFGWALLCVGIFAFFGSLKLANVDSGNFSENMPHYLMGLFFGASHLTYGIYLYFTERKNEA